MRADPAAPTTRWGILGTGTIAHKFATGLRDADGAELVAVGSRSQESADAFGDEFDVPRRHASYDAVAADPDVDIIYVATPHPIHKAAILLCQAHGKAVLCEKPFTVNARDAAEVVGSARAKGLFLMEAMWSRYLPGIVKVRELLADGAIGAPTLLTADFGFRVAQPDPKSRLFNLDLAGGALLDVGIYPVSLASMIFGPPDTVTGVTQIGETGVDETTGVTLTYGAGQMALLNCSVRVNTAIEATIFGTDGALKIESPWYVPERLTLTRAGQQPEMIAVPYRGNGYNYEAEEAGRCLAEGRRESPTMPLDETVRIMETMDEIRAPWGILLPGDV